LFGLVGLVGVVVGESKEHFFIAKQKNPFVQI
jgi:hypothetical protein